MEPGNALNKFVDDLKYTRITNAHGTRHREQTVRAFQATGNRPRRISQNDSESSKADGVENEIPTKHLAFRWENRAVVLTFQGGNLASVEQSAGAFCDLIKLFLFCRPCRIRDFKMTSFFCKTNIDKGKIMP